MGWPVGDLGGIGSAIDRAHQQGEFVATQTRQDVGFPRRAP
jgi:hypothetical protein